MPEDGRFIIRPHVNHRSYPALLEKQPQQQQPQQQQQEEKQHIVKMLMSAEKSDNSVFELTDVFFENWYGYQDELLVHGGRINLFQVFCVSVTTYLTYITVILYRPLFGCG